MGTVKNDRLTKDLWHLSNCLHNFIIDYEEILLSSGIDTLELKDTRDKLDLISAELK